MFEILFILWRTTISSSSVQKPSGRGGARPGAGKPKGSISRRLKTISGMTDRAFKSVKKVPLGTMLRNMERFDDEAEALFEKFKEVVQNEKPGARASKAERNEYIDRVLVIHSKMRECRLDAQRCAVEAAPYVHQRLASITVSQTTDTIAKKSEMDEDDSVDYFNKLRLRPASDVPLNVVIDNETGDVVGHEDDED